MDTFVITIARGFGSGGKEIASMLGKTLNIPCYERRLVEMASEESGLSKALFQNTDERLRGTFLSEKLKQMVRHTLPIPVDKRFVSDKNLYDVQCDIIRNLAATQSCIIVGKCANQVLKEYDNVLSVYIEADRTHCVESVMKKMEVDEAQAHRMIEKTDKYRADYYKFYSEGDYWSNVASYDLTLNSGRFTRAECVAMIQAALKIKLQD